MTLYQIADSDDTNLFTKTVSLLRFIPFNAPDFSDNHITGQRQIYFFFFVCIFLYKIYHYF